METKTVYAVTQRADGSSIYTKIGTAFPGTDGHYHVALEALPFSGTMVMGPDGLDRKPSTAEDA